MLAVVELRAGAQATAADVIGFARRELAHYKCPRHVEFIDALPREPQGKIKKQDLVERFTARRGSEGPG